jgi:hypothetical protein
MHKHGQYAVNLCSIRAGPWSTSDQSWIDRIFPGIDCRLNEDWSHIAHHSADTQQIDRGLVAHWPRSARSICGQSLAIKLNISAIRFQSDTNRRQNAFRPRTPETATKIPNRYYVGSNNLGRQTQDTKDECPGFSEHNKKHAHFSFSVKLELTHAQ